jgi:FSR family fosmidomycin resistance protein-like MFS transporter
MAHASTLILLWLGHFLVDFMLGIWPVFKTLSALDLGFAGIMASCCAFLGEGSQLLFGRLTDKGHHKRLIAIGLLMTASSALLAFSQSYFMLFLFLILTCIGSGAFHPSSVAFIGSLTDKQKGLFISIFASGGALGMAFSQTVFSHTYAYLNGNTFPLIVPTFLLLILLIFFGYHKKESFPGFACERPPLSLKYFREYFQDPALKRLYLTQVCNQTIFWATIFLLPDVLSTREYEDSVAFGGGHMALIIGSAFMMIPSGYLADRFSSRSVILVSSLSGMILFYAFLLLPFLETIYLIPLLLIAGSFLGVVQPVAVALGNDLGRKNPGLVSAFTMGLVWCVSETIGPAGGGLLSKLFVEDAPAKALMILGALFPMKIYAAYRLPKPAQESSPLA